MSPLYSALISTLAISLIPLLGLIFFLPQFKRFKNISILLVGFAIGGLIGDSFIHLLPQAYSQTSSTLKVSLFTITGFLFFFSLEKYLRWQHCHDPDCLDTDHQHVVTINLIGDTVHNFIDGLIIIASYTVDHRLGLATTLAVIIHEIPQEIGDFGIFIHHGLSPLRAIKYNLLSALFAFIGVVCGSLIGSGWQLFSQSLVPITAGGFLYLAASDLVPELHRHNRHLGFSFIQLMAVVAGVALMAFLFLLE